jgi:hypothetical protein
MRAPDRRFFDGRSVSLQNYHEKLVLGLFAKKRIEGVK